VNGEFVPTNENEATFWPWVPDYDPDWWEFEGATLGGENEWYIYMKGKDVHARQAVDIYFAPRLATENPAFPTDMTAGDTVQVPVDWENLDQLPVKMTVALQNVNNHAKYGEAEYTLTEATGNGLFEVTVPTDAPGGQYMWVAYIYPTNAVDTYAERLGFDDTYRSDFDGMPIEPEVMVTVTGTGGVFTVYSDAGLPNGTDLYVWPYGAYVDAEYTILPPPEGVMSCYALRLTGYIGWGVFNLSGTLDMSDFADGYLKFWLFSFETLKVEIEGPQYQKGTVNVPSTGGTWQEITIPVSDFVGADLTQIFGMFEITSYDGAEYLVDHVRWTQNP
jgi:hypothetical protein